MKAVTLLAGAFLLLVVAGCGDKKEASSTTTTAAASGKPKANGCVTVTAPEAKDRSGEKPTSKLDVTKNHDVTISTNCGDFTIRLDPKQSPNAAASFAALAESGFFDNTVFHRISPGFVIQGGDPTATGTGGPGYSTVDTPPAGAQYTHGVVAMAKSAAEPAGTAGSQFFVVTAADTGLSPDYAIIGKVVKGLDVVDRIGGLGNDDETPMETVEIEKATVTST
jgi:peptidyl-prolyl cis-trans isomerase B (cyclophilin B)